MELAGVIERYQVLYPDDPSVEPYICLLYGLALGVNAQLVYEVGVGEGMSTHAFLCAMRKTGGKLISCDIVDSQEAVQDEGLLRHWEFMHCSSADMAYELGNRPGATFAKADIIYIDGNHESAAADEVYFWRAMHSLSLMVFHDYRSVPAGPGQLYLDMLRQGRSVVGIPTKHGLLVARKQCVSR